ncbi:MAG: HD domain-containing protein [Pirellulaceae bacterium]|nr:HD domain-containing protein [Pirellulaceae bacterium]
MQSVLSEAFNTKLSIWCRHSDGWRSEIPWESNPAIEESRWASVQLWLDDLVEQLPDMPQVLPLDGQRVFVAAVSMNDVGVTEVVGGVAPLDPLQLATRAAELAVQKVDAADLHELHDQYAARLSTSYEELCFLRRLSKHVEFCMANRSLVDVAKTTLTELFDLIQVQGLALLQINNQDSVRCESFVDIAVAEGALPHDAEQWRQFIAELGPRSRRVLVKNFNSQMNSQEVIKAPQGVRSMALVPIQKEGQVFGWLLAVNKRSHGGEKDLLINSLGHDELGSMEASLLEVAAQLLASHASNSQLFQELEQLVVSSIHTLVGIVEAKDEYTCGHSHRVALVARQLAQQLNLPADECEDIYTSGLLHDVGKIGVRDEVLLKSGKLTYEEFNEIKQHPVIGAHLLRGLKPLANYFPACSITTRP